MTIDDVAEGDVVRLTDGSAWRVEWRCRGAGVFARRWNPVSWQLAGATGATAHVYLAGNLEVAARAKGGRKPRAVKEAA